MSHPDDETRETVYVPQHEFFYTEDQLCSMLKISRTTLKQHLWYRGRSIGIKTKDQMTAVNLNSHMPEEKPQWRISERDVLRWLRRKGFRVSRT